MSKIPAIYLITNAINRKVYVGQTTNFSCRMSQHRTSVNIKDKYQRPIVAAFKKYGVDNFEFSIIESPSIQDLTVREQYWIDKYQSNKKSNGYNACPAAGSPIGYKHSEETRRKVSLAATGRRHTELTKELISKANSGRKLSAAHIEKIRIENISRKRWKKRGKPIEQLCPVTNMIIEKFISASAAHRKIGGGISPILDVCKGKRKFAGGYKWRFQCPE